MGKRFLKIKKRHQNYKKWLAENENKWISAGISVAAFAVATPFIVYIFSKIFRDTVTFAFLGTVGDFMGGTTVGLLSLASILFLVSTIVMQRKELGMQREELQLTREELTKANLQYEITNETMIKQQFETTYFNMLNMHKITKGELIYEPFNYPTLNLVTGVEAFEYINSEIVNKFKEYSYRTFLRDVIDKYKENNSKELFDSYNSVLYFVGNEKIFKFTSAEDLINEIEKYVPKGIVYLDESGSSASIDDVIFNYEELKKIPVLSENIFSREFHEKFLNDDYYKVMAYKETMTSSKIKNLNNYIRSLIFIFDFIDKTNFKQNEKDNYLKLLFIQINMHELLLIKYTAILEGNTDLSRIYDTYLLHNEDPEFLDLLNLK